MSSFTIFAAKIPFSYYIKLLLLPSFFLLSGTLTILFSFAKRDAILPPVLFSVKFRNWQVFISANNVDTVISLIFVVLSSISCLYFLTLTTPVQTILQVLRKLKVPQLLIEITEITYRFIFVFLETALKIYQAQNSRLGYRTFRLWLHSLGLINLFPVYDRISASKGINDCDGFKRICGGYFISRRPLPIFRNQLAHNHWNHCWGCDCLSKVWR